MVMMMVREVRRVEVMERVREMRGCRQAANSLHPHIGSTDPMMITTCTACASVSAHVDSGLPAMWLYAAVAE